MIFKHLKIPACVFSMTLAICIPVQAQWEVNSDFWAGTDDLGRKLITSGDAGPARVGKYIGMFYHTWHTDGNADFDPVLNLREILEQYPEAIDSFEHPAWQGIAPGVYFWDEPLFGYYRTTDEWILRKHAEMLADAGVDVVFCDATNANLTWKSSYNVLLKFWDQARKDGVRTPQFAFLLPFSPTDGAREAITDIFRDLYQPGRYPDLWFYWKGKPLIMAYPEMLEAGKQGDAAGLKFTASSAFTNIDVSCPSWSNNIGNLTLSIYPWDTDYKTSVAQEPLARETFVNFNDNAMLNLPCDTLAAGEYVWELSNGTETVGVWKYVEDTDSTTSYFNQLIVTGDYECRIKYLAQSGFTPLTTGSLETHVPVQISGGIETSVLDSIRNFFTFRPGQPDYVSGPSRSDHWAWLETYPQHGYAGSPSLGYEQVAVGIAQNANDVSGGRCASFNAPGTYGRSYTKQHGWDTREDAYLWGANFEEQWERAYELDPELIFVTGWNEWIMGRHKDWPGCQGGPQVVNGFPDAFDAERSRDIEPAKSWGSNGDVYYLQLVSKVRKFKGMIRQDSASAPKTIQIGELGDWNGVRPEYLHYKGNTLHRNHPGHGKTLVYRDSSGRNDIVLAKVARDETFIYFYVKTTDALSPSSDPGWMRLFIDIDRDKSTGWEGYDYLLNRESPGDSVTVEQSQDAWVWTRVGSATWHKEGNAMEIGIPRSLLGIETGEELNFEFKWSDNMQDEGNVMDFYQSGDVAPGGRFNFVYMTDPALSVEEGGNPAPVIALSQNYPNPFNQETTIEFNLASSVDARLTVYNVMGQPVKVLLDDTCQPGINRVTWDARNENGHRVDPGLYLYQLESGGSNMLTRRMMLFQ